MGGDDLGSDDEYLDVSALADADTYVDESPSENDEENDNQQQKRKRKKSDNNNELNKSVDRNDLPETSKTKENRKLKKRHGPMQVLGSKIRFESTESKAEILSEFSGADFHAANIAKARNDDNMDSGNFMDRLLCLTSKKQLKRKLQQRSPRVVIFCLSARRCVTILKELAPMRLRVAKLFPKQGTIGEQAKQLETTEFALAVGTPHRIKELIDKRSLTLKNTQLLGLDTFLNPKNQSVYTLHDTAPSLKSILKDYAQPVCKEGKKDLKIGFI